MMLQQQRHRQHGLGTARIWTLAVCILTWMVSTTIAATPAFPGALGAGAMTRGGRGGKVLLVTNLRDSGPGSFRKAVETPGPRTVVFRVAGYIELQSPIRVSRPNITIAGQSAPGAGVCLKNYSLQIGNTQQVIIRHIRCRPGDKTSAAGEMDAITIWDSQHVILDHCSATWSTDECLSVTRQSDNITVQACLIAEALTSHSMGSIIGGDGGRISFINNLYASNRSRNPRISALIVKANQPLAKSPTIDFRNNVVYNWSYSAGYAGGSDPNIKEATRVNMVANYYRPGPDTRPGRQQEVFRVNPGAVTELFISQNVLHGFSQATADNTLLIKQMGGVLKRMNQPHKLPQVPAQTATVSYQRVLREAGAVLPVRDAIDRRIVSGVRNGNGRQIGSKDQTPGWLPLNSAAPAVDRDQDGMPDTWEEQYRLDRQDATDHRSDPDGDGYTNLEEWLNGTSPQKPNR